MKAELLKEKIGYQPKKLVITIESQEEEDTLKAFCYQSGYDLNKHINEHVKLNNGKTRSNITACTDLLSAIHHAIN